MTATRRRAARRAPGFCRRRWASACLSSRAPRRCASPRAGEITVSKTPPKARGTRRTPSGGSANNAVSLFLVNRRAASLEPEHEDEAIAFQADLEIESPRPIVARMDLSGRDGNDIDARIGDLHYRDVVDWAVGHNVSVAAEVEDGLCRQVRTCWLPS